MNKIKPIPIFIRRRILINDLNKLVDDVKNLSRIEGVREYKTAIYDLVRTFIFSNESFAKEIRHKSDLYLDWHGYYFDVEYHILCYINDILNKNWKKK